MPVASIRSYLPGLPNSNIWKYNDNDIYFFDLSKEN